MKYDPAKHHRRSIRLKNYDYTRSGIYAITLCLQHRQHHFGHISETIMHLTPAGRMVQANWELLPTRFPHIELDAYVVMPNHFHGLLIATAATNIHIGDVIGAFKSLTTTQYIIGVNEHGWPPFYRRLWQRNYYEQIVRNPRMFTNIRHYIRMNPVRWSQDRENHGPKPHDHIETFLYQRASHN